MPIDRDQAKRDAELAHEFFIRLEARGHSRKECVDLTVAWLLARRADRELLDVEPREPWETDG